MYLSEDNLPTRPEMLSTTAELQIRGVIHFPFLKR